MIGQAMVSLQMSGRAVGSEAKLYLVGLIDDVHRVVEEVVEDAGPHCYAAGNSREQCDLGAQQGLQTSPACNLQSTTAHSQPTAEICEQQEGHRPAVSSLSVSRMYIQHLHLVPQKLNCLSILEQSCPQQHASTVLTLRFACRIRYQSLTAKAV